MMHNEAEQRLMREALQRARPEWSRPTNEDVAAFLDGTIKDEAVLARIVGEIGTDPVLTGAVLAGEGRGSQHAGEEQARLVSRRLGWRISWAAAAVLVVAATGHYFAGDSNAEPRVRAIELLDDDLSDGTGPSRTGEDQSKAQDAVWMFAAWFLLVGLTFPVWRTRPESALRDLHS